MKKLQIVAFILISFIFFSCGKKDDSNKNNNNTKGEFSWSENVSIDKIPDYPIKGFMNGKEVKIEYINFEKWRGSGDNVINFGNKTPSQKCGFVENDIAFHLTKTGADLTEGQFLKENFTKNVDGYSAEYHFYVDNFIKKVSSPWNCALVLTEINETTVKGKISICFKDDSKSWIAGSFEAVRCNN